MAGRGVPGTRHPGIGATATMIRPCPLPVLPYRGGLDSGEGVHQDADVVAFEDINPQAPLHCLIIPRRHIATLNDMQVEDAASWGRCSTGPRR